MEPEWYELAIPTGKNVELTHLGLVVFAQQGYFVVAINPSGSTTFGQGTYHPGSFRSWLIDSARFSDLTDAIKEDWGGKPFVDLRKGWQYILDNYPQVRSLAPCDVYCT